MLKLLDTTTIKSGSEADKDACPRCQGRVFHAEKVEVKDKAYHKIYNTLITNIFKKEIQWKNSMKKSVNCMLQV